MFLFVLTTATLFAQPNKKINVTDSIGRKQGYWKKYANDTLKYEGTFKDNFPVGEFKYYFPNKNVKAITNYSNNGTTAKTTLLYDNGKKNAEGTYMDKKKDGTWIYYSASEGKMSEENYQNGIKSGVWKYYYENGKVNKIETYKNDLLEGLCEEYYADSVIKMRVNYTMGKQQGIVKYYGLTGKIFLTGMFQNDIKDGEWMFFNENGFGDRKLTYKAGTVVKEEIITMNKNEKVCTNILDIAYCEQKGTEIFIRLNSGEQIPVSYNLSQMENLLGENHFFRVNANFIIALRSFKNRKTFNIDNPVLTLNPDPGIPVVVEKSLLEGFMSWAGMIKYDNK